MTQKEPDEGGAISALCVVANWRPERMVMKLRMRGGPWVFGVLGFWVWYDGYEAADARWALGV